ncbi:2-oxoglutarate dehydrogenase, E2 component, dihydrolipoamide succinyltransferase [Serinicoccus sediminis]|uniref:2-oxoglutarate dehydrogenase, E2 component, dihydrolipoamide succinyltransferase n=1 Tax=Serinicoccus sediminis TaxID=2306021 RepID=UPI001020A706|nr:2-oxoglutarate dehydrogenase, E2 component, dihydrolipoamide succinyltransferase [Serinicoccus sediminis]
MSERVSMPALGESVTEGTITRWLKSVGDAVEVDEPLLEVSTDKVDTEIPSPVAGVLQEILAEEDDTVEVGADLCVVGDDEGGSGDDGGSSEADDEQDGSAQDDAEQDEQGGDDEQTSDEQTSDDGSSSDDTSGGGTSEGGSSDGGSSGGSSGGETVTMPALGESVTEGTVTRWLKSEGDTVEVDEPLLEVSTDKVDTEIPSPVAGVLTSILAAEDETVEVGGELAVIGGESSGSSDGGQEQQDDAAGADAQEKDDAGSDDAGSDDTGEKDEAQQQDDSGSDEEGGSSDDLAEESDKHEQAAEESAEKSGTSEADDSGVATGVGTTSAENGTTSHKDADGDGTPDGQQRSGSDEAPSQDVSAYVTPLVRKLAAQHGVDLASLSGTGVGGRVRKQDVLDAAQAKKQQSEQAASEQPAAEEAPAEQAPAQGGSGAAAAGGGSDAKRGTTEKMSRLRKVIATRMVESLQTSAQLTTVVEVDVTKISRLRKRAKDEFLKREGTKLSFMPFFAMAAIEALKEHPIVNASVEDDTIVYHAAEHLGVAVDTPRGLLVPVIKDAGDLNIAGLARKIADLAERTRDNKVGPDELSGGTFTLTNTGSRGALFDTPIINQPNVGILGTGAVVKRPVVVVDEDGMETIAIRDMVYLAISYDHRVVDGADAARFLATMKERLQDGKFEV